MNIKTCVQNCPEESDIIIDDVCTNESCPAKTLKQEEGTDIRCVSSCSKDRKLYNGTCVVNCPVDKSHNYNGICVTACPDDKPRALKSGGKECIDNCNDRKLFLEGECIYSYQCDSPMFEFDGACIARCPKMYRFSTVYACVKETTLRLYCLAFALLLGFIILYSRRVLLDYATVIYMCIKRVSVTFFLSKLLPPK